MMLCQNLFRFGLKCFTSLRTKQLHDINKAHFCALHVWRKTGPKWPKDLHKAALVKGRSLSYFSLCLNAVLKLLLNRTHRFPHFKNIFQKLYSFMCISRTLSRGNGTLKCSEFSFSFIKFLVAKKSLPNTQNYKGN